MACAITFYYFSIIVFHNRCFCFSFLYAQVFFKLLMFRLRNSYVVDCPDTSRCLLTSRPQICPLHTQSFCCISFFSSLLTSQRVHAACLSALWLYNPCIYKILTFSSISLSNFRSPAYYSKSLVVKAFTLQLYLSPLIFLHQPQTYSIFLPQFILHSIMFRTFPYSVFKHLYATPCSICISVHVQFCSRITRFPD
jgi:hypothetical protein